MAISRFDKFTPRDYNMEWYMPKEFIPDFEAWNTMLAGKQSKYDTAVALSQKLPKHLAHRVDLAGQYKQKTDQAINDISSAYTKDISAGDRMLRDYGLNMNRDWQAGGLAYELEQEAAEYAKAQEEISKYYKDAKAEHSANKNLAMYKLQEAAKKDFGYDPNTGLYTRASISADTTSFVDIMEEAQKVIKEIKDSGNTTITNLSPAWLLKIKQEGVSPETIKGVAQELLKQPKYAQQLAIEQWDKKRRYTPDQLTEMETNYRKNANDQLTTEGDELLKTTKNKKDAIAIQEMLTKEGFYTATIDGKFGNQSKKAFNEWLQSKRDSINEVDADTIISKQLINSYVDPLVKTYTRMNIDKTPIFNKQWGVERQIQGQAQNNAIFAQTLMRPEPGEYLVSPGAARPMDKIDKMTATAKTTYEDAKKTFNMVVSKSPIAGQNYAPHEINMITMARMESKTPQEFQSKLASYGVMVPNVQATYDWYSSPEAVNLNTAYKAMSSAGHQLQTYTNSQEAMLNQFIKTEEGKKYFNNLKKKKDFSTLSDADLIKMIATNNLKANDNTGGVRYIATPSGMIPTQSDISGAVSDLKRGIDKWVQNNPDALPVSLRGYAITATKGVGATLTKDIITDLQSGNTAGYSYGDMPLQFTTADGKKINTSDLDANSLNVRITSDAKGVTYYISGKDNDKNSVTGVATAPVQHNGRLANISKDMLLNAKQTGDKYLENLAAQIYNNTKGDNASRYASENMLILDNKNSGSLNEVINPAVKDRIVTFGGNPNVKGRKVGGEISMNGETFQKYKIKNEVGKDVFMMTRQVADKNGNIYYAPILNESGGLYYDNSSDAEMPLIKSEMMSQLNVEYKTGSFKTPNMTEQQAAALLAHMNSNDILNQND